MADVRSRAVTFFFDPACPWTWVTSRWLVAAAAQRDLTITWRPYSLLAKNGEDVPEERRSGLQASHRALRVIVDLDREIGNEAVAAFYTEIGHRTFTDGQAPVDLADALRAPGLDRTHADAADDTSLDTVIQSAMDDAHDLAGTGSGSPILAVAGTGRGFFGPVLTAVPGDENAGALWDHLVGLQAITEFHELKRDRDTSPTFPPRG
ncbi:DsbA family protein [soil metagenome]